MIGKKYNLGLIKKLKFSNIISKSFSIKTDKEKLNAFLSKNDAEIKDKSKVFTDRLNNVEKINDDFQDIDAYLKVLNEKSNQDNFEVVKKITEIFKDDTNSVKVFTVVQEINKINLSNSTNILKLFLSTVLKYNDAFKVYLEETNKINRRYKIIIPFSLFIFSIIGLIYLKSQIKYRSNKVAEKIVNNYFDNIKFMFKLNIKFPIFNDHRNLTNSIFFNNNNMLIIIGPSGVGKTESIKNYCFKDSQNGKFLIYIDLKCEKYFNKDIKQILDEKLIEEVKQNTWLSHQMNNVGVSNLLNDVVACLVDKDVTIILDHYMDERDNKLVFSNLSFFKNLNMNVMILANNNEVLSNAIKGKFNKIYFI